jgi:phosphohistidine phosphatase
MKIYLVRHGIAAERLGGAVLNDSQRPLTDEGKAETKLVAQGLKRLGVEPGLLIASPLVRARQTAEIFADVLSVKEEVKVTDALAPGGSSSNLYKFLRQLKAVEEIALFGHEPDIGRLTATLMWAGPELDLPFKKAGVARVDVQDLPPTSPGTLKWLITPKIASLLVK